MYVGGPPYLPEIKLRVGWEPRVPRFPRGDDALGHVLHELLIGRWANGAPRPTAFLMRADLVEIVDLPPLLQNGPLVHRLFSALAGQEGVEAMAVVGVMHWRRPPVARFSVTFVEWSDGRWWLARRRVDDDDPVDEVQRAVDGSPRPGGLGGWFSRARFEGIRARIETHGANAVN